MKRQYLFWLTNRNYPIFTDLWFEKEESEKRGYTQITLQAAIDYCLKNNRSGIDRIAMYCNGTQLYGRIATLSIMNLYSIKDK